MRLLPRFKCSNPNMVFRLHKSLYDLKHAPRCWFTKLDTSLKSYGFRQSYFDYSLLTYTRGTTQINVLMDMDDLIIFGNNSNAIKTFKGYLSSFFEMKGLGSLKYFLGIEVAGNSNTLFLCQRKYTLDIVNDTGRLGAKPTGFPIKQNHKLGLAHGKLLVDLEAYRWLVGRLIYLAVTCLDLGYSVHILSQYMHAHRTEH